MGWQGMRNAGRSLVALLCVGLAFAAAANAETGDAGGVEPTYGKIGGSVLAEGEVLVCATSVATYLHYCFVTQLGAGYLIGDLPPGTYVVRFVPANSLWEPEYYLGMSTYAEATQVTVAAGVETHLASVLLRLKGERPLEGGPLQEPPPDVLAPVNNPDAEVVFPAAPVAPSSLRTAPELVISPARLLSAASLRRLSVSCQFNACNGSIKLVRQMTAKDGHTVRAVLGWASFSLKKDVPSTIAIRLTPLGRRELKRAGHHSISASIVASMEGRTVRTQSVQLT